MTLLTMPEVAKYLRIGKTEAYRMAARGEFPSIKIGRRRRVDKERLDEWLRDNEEPDDE